MIDGKWYVFTWKELVRSKLYVATEHATADEAILRVFETGGLSPNEFKKEFSELQESCKKHPVIAMRTDS